GWSSWSVICTLPASGAFAGSPSFLNASRHDTSAPLGQLSAGARGPTSATDREALAPRSTGPALSSGRVDVVASELAGPLEGVSTVLRFDGQSAADNRRVFGFAFVPPDTNGAAGASHVLPIVDGTHAPYGKRHGAPPLWAHPA